jgi:hypothetical protein
MLCWANRPRRWKRWTAPRAALAGDSAGRERVEALARDLKIGG